MESGVHSETAERTAALRAMHFLHGDRPLVFEDPFAIELIGSDWREQYLRGVYFGYKIGAGIVLGRARYTEELLEAAVRSGVNQYVIVGAGLDTFALRRPDLVEKVRVYEIDHPSTQEWKRKRLSQLDQDLPAALEFIPADLEHETVTEALDRSSFRNDQRTFFSWLGTLPYLTHKAIIHTLESLAAASAFGSEIVFDYMVPIEFVYPEDVPIVEASWQTSGQWGEPKHSWLNPLIFPNEVIAVGFDMVESLSPKQMEERYFAGRSDGLRPLSHLYYAHFRNSTKVDHQR